MAEQGLVVGGAAGRHIAADGDVAGMEGPLAAASVRRERRGQQGAEPRQAAADTIDGGPRRRQFVRRKRHGVDLRRVADQRLDLHGTGAEGVQARQQARQLGSVAPAQHHRQGDVAVEQRVELGDRRREPVAVGARAQGFGRLGLQAVDRDADVAEAPRLQPRVVGRLAHQGVGVEADGVELARGICLVDHRGDRGVQGWLADALQDQRLGWRRVPDDGPEPVDRHMRVAPGPILHADGSLATDAAKIAARRDLDLQAAQTVRGLDRERVHSAVTRGAEATLSREDEAMVSSAGLAPVASIWHIRRLIAELMGCDPHDEMRTRRWRSVQFRSANGGAIRDMRGAHEHNGASQAGPGAGQGDAWNLQNGDSAELEVARGPGGHHRVLDSAGRGHSLDLAADPLSRIAAAC